MDEEELEVLDRLAWWCEREMSSHILGYLNSWSSVEGSLRGVALLEEVRHWTWALRV